MKILYIVFLFISILGAWLCSLLSFFPINRPFLFIGFFAGISVILLILVDRNRGQSVKSRFLKLTAILVLLGFALSINQLRYKKFNQSYISGDTQFSLAAQKVMPELSIFDSAKTVEHYHGQKYDEEWVVLKATLYDEQFETFVESTKAKYTFYEEARINNAVFCPCDNTFSIEDYEFYVIDLSDDIDATLQPYAAAIALNDSDHSITCLFIESHSFQFMGLDGVIRIIWPYMGVEM